MNNRIRSSNEKIIGPENCTIGDFWAWAYSDVLSNRNRSIFAEYIVATALGVTNEPRIEWDSVDLRYEGIAIEVKSSAYVQSWKQEKLSDIKYDIKKKKGWDAFTNTFSPIPIRSSDCYIFCLFAEKRYPR